MDVVRARLRRRILDSLIGPVWWAVPPLATAVAGCAEPSADWPECGNEEELTAAEYQGYGTLEGGDFYVCGELPSDGSACVEAEALNASAFFAANVGVASTNDAGYYLTAECGPEPTREDACCYVLEHSGYWMAGRPFYAAGAPRIAPLVAAGKGAGPKRGGVASKRQAGANERARRAAVWANIGQAEHASVAAFARFTLDLMALGAPLSLLDAAARAQRDEIRHARFAFAMATRLGGAAVSAGPLPTDGALGPASPTAVASALAREGCVEETLSACAMGESAPFAPTVAERHLLERIARDESRHAMLAWESARWILATFPATRLPFSAALREASRVAAVRDPRAARMVHEVVGPAAAALLGSTFDVGGQLP